ncbi:DUF2388 domain-containing protein [Pseudomonas sp. NPDC090964]|uniref:DUF2388 domain-containing protein n=1 Tax=Pseudomonas sp. NPDC090964 TaxID=3364482 RepID=UPI0038302F10
MNPRKTAAIVAMALIGTQAMANEKATPFDKVMTYTSILPTALTTLPSYTTDDSQKPLKSAKTDALAFIGSDGEIRGAQFEQASRYYRATYSSPLMSDMQLAQAIASSF